MDITFNTSIFLADIVLIVHASFVLFVIFGLILIVIGGYRHWLWIRNSWFRAIHLLSISIVVLQSWLGVICPLTTLEMWLREKAGGNIYEGSFVQYWLHKLLYYNAPWWVFIVAYSLFALLVILAMAKFPPNFMRKNTL